MEANAMGDQDPVMVDLDRYLTTLDEDYECPFEVKRRREEYLADSYDYEYEDLDFEDS
jgi:hypothetical protein